MIALSTLTILSGGYIMNMERIIQTAKNTNDRLTEKDPVKLTSERGNGVTLYETWGCQDRDRYVGGRSPSACGFPE